MLKNKLTKTYFDKIAAIVIKSLSTVVPLIFATLLIILFYYSLPAIKNFKLNFLINTNWNPGTLDFGALTSIYGTLVTSILSIAIAFPISLFLAFFLNNYSPQSLKKIFSTAIELLAAIPSIIYGMIGLFVLVPILGGLGIHVAILILSLMILPYLTTVMFDMLKLVPNVLLEAAYGLGATPAEVIFKVIIPYVKKGFIGAILIGLGRALGETMAVTFVIGNSHDFSFSLFSPGNTISSTLANEFVEATEPMHQSSLIYLGLVLLLISFAIQLLTSLYLKRLDKKMKVAL